ATALAGLYKLAGIDLVREQVRANLPAPIACFDVTARDLILWLNQRHGKAILYDLDDLSGHLPPRNPDRPPAPDRPVLEGGRLLFGKVSISWQEWVESWQKDRAGRMPLTLAGAGITLLPGES